MRNPESKQHKPSLSREEAYLAANFAAGLEKTRPYLFNLADQVLEAYPERQWGAIFVDDNNGRLPARFIRQILLQHNINLPMRFINGGRQARKNTSTQDYEDYIEAISQGLSYERVLLITEQTSRFEASSAIARPLLSRFGEIDLASLNQATEEIEPPEIFSKTFFGSSGPEATTNVNLTFESIDILENIQGKKKRLIHRFLPLAVRAEVWRRKQMHVDHGTTYPLTNLDQRLVEESSPMARRSTETKFRLLAAHCFAQMNRLALEYAGQPEPVVTTEKAADKLVRSTKPLPREV